MTATEVEDPYSDGERHLSGRSPRVLAEAVTGEDGKYAMEWPELATVEIWYEQPGWQAIPDARVTFVALPEGRRNPVRLPAEPSIRLRVLDTSGQPVDGARLRVLGAALNGGDYSADEAGLAELPLRPYGFMEPHSESLWVLPPVGRTDLAPHPMIEAAPLEENRITLAPARPQTLQVYKPDGSPADRALVEVLPDPGSTSVRMPLALGDSKGRVTVPRPVRGEPLRLHVLTREGDWTLTELPPYEASAEPEPLSLRLQEPTPLEVKLRSAWDEMPLQGARVGVAWQWMATTGDDGSAEFQLPVGRDWLADHRITVRALGYETKWVHGEELSEPLPQPLIFRLSALTLLGGRVVDAEGRGIEGAVAQAVPGTDLAAASPAFQDLSNAGGFFGIEGISPGDSDFTLQVTADGYQPTSTLQEPLRMYERRTSLEITLQAN